MSKLEDIIASIGYGVDGEKPKLTDQEAKQQIKDLMLDIAGDNQVTNGAFADVNEINEHQNEVRNEIRQKVNEL